MKKKDKDCSYDVNYLMRLFHEYSSYKRSKVSAHRLTRSLYKGEFWEVFKRHLKEYTMTPDWNYYEYVVQAYLNSIYSGAFIGTITPRNPGDTEIVDKLNNFVAYNWNKWGMKNKFLHIGENGELYNLGGVRVDWTDKYGQIKLKPITFDEVYLDPSVDNYKEGQALFLERGANINTLRNNPTFGEAVEDYLKRVKHFNNKTIHNKIAGYENPQGSDNKIISLIECFIRNEDDNIEQIFIIDETEIIFSKVLPIDKFPVVIYTPQKPDGDPYGTSKLNKITNSVITLNLLDSMEATQPYRLLNRTKFIDNSGRINLRAFIDYGNTPGASFETFGDPTKLVHYVDVPTIPDMTNLKNRLENSIFQITGVDPYYKGRMTNSLQTTGATQAFQARVTMLTDNSRITMLEEFCEDLTRLVIEYYLEYGGDHEYKIPKMAANGVNRAVDVHTINFKQLKDNNFKFDYFISASTLLPMNQANLFESAKALYEMQGQYQFDTQIITPQDLIRFSDFPQKHLFLDRFEQESSDRITEDVISILTNFASIFSNLLSQGLTTEQASAEAIQIIIEERNAMKSNNSLGRGLE